LSREAAYNTGLMRPLELLTSDPLAFAMLAVSLVMALTLHEFAHAYTADLLGDRLPRAYGRVSLNPARHLDPLGTLLLFLVGFGWAKPVQFRPEALRSKRFGAALVALAGPLMNLLLGVLGVVALRIAVSTLGIDEVRFGQVGIFLQTFISINILLAVFNLMPLPPLDGSRLLTIFLPPDKQKIVYFLDRYGFFILIGLVLFGGLTFIYRIANVIASFIGDLVF